MKGEIKPDHMAVNNFDLLVVGLVDLTALKISGLEEELEKIMLPDRTAASGGQKKSTEFNVTIPMHHELETAAMELWFVEGQDPVTPTYKKPATLVHHAVSGTSDRSYTLMGCWVQKRKLPDLDREDDGKLALIEYTISVDNILPI